MVKIPERIDDGKLKVWRRGAEWLTAPTSTEYLPPVLSGNPFPVKVGRGNRNDYVNDL